RRGRTDGSAFAKDVQALLQRFARDYAKRRIARSARQAGRSNRTRHGHGLDVRASRIGIWPKGSTRCRMGWRDSRACGMPDQSVLVAGEGFAREVGRAFRCRGLCEELL